MCLFFHLEQKKQLHNLNRLVLKVLKSWNDLIFDSYYQKWCCLKTVTQWKLKIMLICCIFMAVLNTFCAKYAVSKQLLFLLYKLHKLSSLLLSFSSLFLHPPLRKKATKREKEKSLLNPPQNISHCELQPHPDFRGGSKELRDVPVTGSSKKKRQRRRKIGRGRKSHSITFAARNSTWSGDVKVCKQDEEKKQLFHQDMNV